MVWGKEKKTNKLQNANTNRKCKGTKKSNVRGKNTKNAGGT